jgi:hypothetical protein
VCWSSLAYKAVADRGSGGEAGASEGLGLE